MRTLSKLQIDLIRGDIRQSGVEMRELEDDLLDHVCCALEHEDEKLSFEDIYQRVKETLFTEGYRKIQEETTYLLTLKYKKMKKTMNSLGIAGSLMLLIGSILKVLHLMGANETILLGGIVLVLGYLPFMLALSMKHTDSLSGKVRNISGYIGAAAIITGVVFNILHLYPAKILMLGGIGIFLIIFLPLFLKSIGKDLVMKIHPVTSAVIILAVVSTLFAFNNKRTSGNFRSALAEINNNTTQLYALKHERLLDLRREKEGHQDLSAVSEDAILYINKLKQEMLDVYGIQNPDLNLQGWDMIVDSGRFEELLLKGNDRYSYHGAGLQNKLRRFNEIIRSSYPSIKTSFNKIESESWLKDHFKDVPFISAYSYLSQLQLEIADLEMEALRK